MARDEGKRGGLLRRLYAEARMTIDAYRTVYEQSIEFGSRKLTQAAMTKGSLADDIEALEAKIAELHVEVGRLGRLCEGLEFREAEKERGYEGENPEVTALKAEQKQLQDLLVVLRPSKPEKGK